MTVKDNGEIVIPRYAQVVGSVILALLVAILGGAIPLTYTVAADLSEIRADVAAQRHLMDVEVMHLRSQIVSVNEQHAEFRTRLYEIERHVTHRPPGRFETWSKNDQVEGSAAGRAGPSQGP